MTIDEDLSIGTLFGKEIAEIKKIGGLKIIRLEGVQDRLYLLIETANGRELCGLGVKQIDELFDYICAFRPTSNTYKETP